MVIIQTRKTQDMSRRVITWKDNKVRELGTVCLPWQHWTKNLV